MAFPKDKDELDFGMGTMNLPASHGTGNINQMETCTYNEAHYCSAGKYLDHLTKCRQRHEGKSACHGDDSELQVCPFNPRHHVHFSVMNKHVQLCDGYYKVQMDNQEDPPSMLQSAERYHVVAPIEDDAANEDFDNASDFGEDDDDAPLRGVVIRDGLSGVEHHPKTRAEFRMYQEEIVGKLVAVKLRLENREVQQYGLETFHALPDASQVEVKMQDVAKFASAARDKIRTDLAKRAV